MKNFSIIFLLCFSMNLQAVVPWINGGQNSDTSGLTTLIGNISNGLADINSSLDVAEKILCGATSLDLNGNQVQNGLIINSTGYSNCNGGLQGDYNNLNKEVQLMLAKLASSNYHSAAGQCENTDLTILKNMIGYTAASTLGQISNVLSAIICYYNHQTDGLDCQAPPAGTQCNPSTTPTSDANSNTEVCVPSLPTNTAKITLGVNASMVTLAAVLAAQISAFSSAITPDDANNLLSAAEAFQAVANNPAINDWNSCYSLVKANQSYVKQGVVCPANIANICCSGNPNCCYTDATCSTPVTTSASVPYCTSTQLVNYLNAVPPLNSALVNLYEALIKVQPGLTINTEEVPIVGAGVVSQVYMTDTSPTRLSLPSFCTSTVDSDGNPSYNCVTQYITSDTGDYITSFNNLVSQANTAANTAQNQYNAVSSRMAAFQQQFISLNSSISNLLNGTAIYPTNKNLASSIQGLFNFCKLEIQREQAYFARTFGLAETIIGTFYGLLAFTGVGALGVLAVTVIYGLTTTFMPIIASYTTQYLANLIVYGYGKGELPPAPSNTIFQVPFIPSTSQKI